MKKLLNAYNVTGVYPHKGERCYKKYYPNTGVVKWFKCSDYELAFSYETSSTDVPVAVVHAKHKPMANAKGYVELTEGLIIVSNYKYSVCDSGSTYIKTIDVPRNSNIKIKKVEYSKYAAVPHTVWYTIVNEVS